MHSISALVVLVSVITVSCSGTERKVSTTGDFAKGGPDSVKSGAGPSPIDSFAEPPISPAMRTALDATPEFVPWQAQDFAEAIRRSYRPDAENGLWWIVADLNGDGIDDVALSGRARKASPMVVALLSEGAGFVTRVVYHADATPNDTPIVLRAPGGGIALTVHNSSQPTLMFWNGERFLVREGY